MTTENHFTVKWLPPILAYCLASISMTLTNKLVLSRFEYKMPFMMLAVQSMASVSLLELCVYLQLIKPHRQLNAIDVKRWLPISCLMAVMLFTGSKSLQFLSVPVFTIFKNLSIILVAFGESKVFGGKVTRLMLISFVLMVLSSVIAAQSDFYKAATSAADKLARAETVTGYFWMAINCISSASFVLFMRYYMKFKDTSVANTKPGEPGSQFQDFDTVFYNNVLTAPIFFIMSLLGADGNLTDFYTYYQVETAERNSFVGALLFSGVSAFAISYASAWCIRVTNSTTYSMVGALNKLPIALSGLIFFADNGNLGSRILSIIVGFASGLLYTVAKIRYDHKVRSLQQLPTVQKSSD